ncbi:MAG TPA: cytochrome c1 [Alphaproteobacteria bacterium]|nr:cytochrome c1 [Alphaproteobacteria bacterium]
MQKPLAAAAAAALALGIVLPAHGADEQPQIERQQWSFYGVFGAFDRAAEQRGFEVYKDVCANCHSLNLLAYRDLAEIGLTAAEVNAVAASVQVEDGPNDQGQMFERPGKPSDRFKAPFANDEAARVANNGALPPDLSLIVKAREGGPDYVYSILAGFKEPPAGFKMTEGMSYNTAFPGHQIAMPPPLSEGVVSYTDGTKATVPQMAHDVVTFLAWAANPELETRHRVGVKTIIFLVILTGLLYAVKRKVWADVH